jgi:hypothetical protein
VNPECGMAIETVNLFMGRAGNQRELYAVHICQRVILLSLGLKHEKDTKCDENGLDEAIQTFHGAKLLNNSLTTA